ncbi:hypothetical protein [Streptomyces sp. NPDC059009]
MRRLPPPRARTDTARTRPGTAARQIAARPTADAENTQDTEVTP